MVLHRVPELAGATFEATSRVIDPVPLWPVRQGLVLMLLPNRLLEFNSENPAHQQTRVLREAKQMHIGNFTALTAARDGGIWIGGSQGLSKIPGPIRNLKPETVWSDYPAPPSLQIKNLQGLHEDEDGGVTAVAESMTNQLRDIVYFNAGTWAIQWSGAERVRQAWRGADKMFWAMSTEGLFEGEPARPNATRFPPAPISMLRFNGTARFGWPLPMGYSTIRPPCGAVPRS